MSGAPATSDVPEATGARARTYTRVAIVLHWLIAAAIVMQLVLAWRMQGPRTPETFALIQLHKSVGITILLLSLARLAWRLMHPPPPLPESLARWERVLARLTHAALYVIMIGMPLTGWLMVSASRLAIPTRLYGVVHWPHLPGIAHAPPAVKAAWYTLGLTGHHLLAVGLFVLLALHVAGALKHQLFASDEPVFARMAPGARAGRRLEPRLGLVATAILAMAGFGWLVSPQPLRTGPRNLPGASPPAPLQLPLEAPAATLVVTPAVPARPAGASVAAEPAAPIPDPIAWKVAPQSTLSFDTAWSGQPIRGRFDRWTADVAFSPETLDRSHVRVTVDVASAGTGDGERDASLKSGDWLDADAHPKAVFTANRFEKTGAETYVAHGSLELRGVRRRVDLPFRLRTLGDTAHVTGRTTIQRSDFGVGRGEWTATDQIPAAVSIVVDLRAQRTDRS
jgi:cytochrome b561/polyisoprenoid-binding protein YceI